MGFYIFFYFKRFALKIDYFFTQNNQFKKLNMPLYFGFPVTCNEAFRLFGLYFEQVKCDIMQKYNLTENMYMDCYFVDYANEFFKEKDVYMRVFYTDKGQCIIGYELKSLSVFEKKFVTSRDFINSIQNYESIFWDEVKRIDCYKNFNKIVLEHMEDEPENVTEECHPYVLEFYR
jgi:hypothetical protein